MQGVFQKIPQKIPLSLAIIAIVLPFSNFLFWHKVDAWNAFGYVLQTSILVLYSFHVARKSPPLAGLFLWAGCLTQFFWFLVQTQDNQYPVMIFLPFFNFLCMVVLFDLITQYVNKENALRILKCLAISVYAMAIYAVLQKINCDQFYNNIDLRLKVDTVVGTLGNPMHFAHFIGMTLPVLFLFKRNIGKIAVLIALSALLFTNSASGILVAIVTLGFYSLFYRHFKTRELLLLVLFIAVFAYFKCRSINQLIGYFLNTSGRMQAWREFFKVFRSRPITGVGLGIINQIAMVQGKALYGWRHVHNEFYHYAIELGLVGVGFIFWGIVNYFNKFKALLKDEVTVISASMFLGFLTASLFGFPSHIWLMSFVGLLGYSFLFIEGQVNENTTGNTK